MSERSNGVRGIHYEISEPVKNRLDGHYYQRVRQVDENGNLVGIGEQIHRSAEQGSTDGLVGRPLDLGKFATLTGNTLQTALGAVIRNWRMASTGATRLAASLQSGVTEDYKSWPGTNKPWEPLFDWRTGSSPIDFVRDAAPGEIGDSNGIGSRWDDTRNLSRNRSQRDVWANVPVPNFSAPPPPENPAWNHVFVRDSAAAAGVPSRNNVFEYGFPDSGRAELSKREPSVSRSVFDTGVSSTSWFPSFQGDAPGGLVGMMARAGVIDPSNPNPPPPGGLAALVQDYLRNNPQRGN